MIEALSPATRGHLAFVDGFREMGLSPGKTVHEQDGLLLCHPGTPDSLYFNTMFRTRPLMPAADTVEAADAFFSDRARGYSIVARRGVDDDLVQHALDVGATFMDRRLPQMGRSTPLPTPTPPDAFDIRPLPTGSEHQFVELVCTIFDPTEEEREADRIVLNDPWIFSLPHISVLVAYENGEPVGTGMGRLSHGVGYLSWIGTLPAVRRKGLGATLTAKLTNDLFASGATEVLLDASTAGEPLYNSMGFVEQAMYCRLSRALP